MILYDLAGTNKEVRFSPFCWLAKLGLLHKGVDFETIALGFLPKEDYPDPEYGKLPMLKDGDTLVKNSPDILAYLDAKITENPYTQGAGAEEKLAQVQHLVNDQLFPAIAPVLMHRVAKAIPANEADYFRKTREERFGVTLEQLASDPQQPAKVTTVLETVASLMGSDDWLGGANPDLSDYSIAAVLLWKKSITSENLYETPAAIGNWLERIDGLFDGYTAKLNCAGC